MMIEISYITTDIQIPMYTCYRTHLASDVVPAKDQNQKVMVAAMAQLAVRSSSGQDDPILHLAPMIFSWTGW
jgi:hypothetical protein